MSHRAVSGCSWPRAGRRSRAGPAATHSGPEPGSAGARAALSAIWMILPDRADEDLVVRGRQVPLQFDVGLPGVGCGVTPVRAARDEPPAAQDAGQPVLVITHGHRSFERGGPGLLYG